MNAIQYFNVVSIKSRKLCGDIEIDSKTRISSSGKKLEIVNPNRTWELTAATPEVASKWAACLKSFLTRKVRSRIFCPLFSHLAFNPHNSTDNVVHLLLFSCF